VQPALLVQPGVPAVAARGADLGDPLALGVGVPVLGDLRLELRDDLLAVLLLPLGLGGLWQTT